MDGQAVGREDMEIASRDYILRRLVMGERKGNLGLKKKFDRMQKKWSLTGKNVGVHLKNCKQSETYPSSCLPNSLSTFFAFIFLFYLHEDMLLQLVSLTCEQEILAASRCQDIKNKYFQKFRLIPDQTFL